MLINKIDYLEFYVFNAFQAANFYISVLGFDIIAYGSLETGLHDKIFYILMQGNIKLILSSAINKSSPLIQHVIIHDDSVKDIAFLCDNVCETFNLCLEKGAKLILYPTEVSDGKNKIIKASIITFGDTVHSFIEYKSDSLILPFYIPISNLLADKNVGLKEIDHLAIALEASTIKKWQEFYEIVFGFHVFYSEDIYLCKSGMLSVVLSDNNDRIKFVFVEPISKGEKSQIETYINYNGGPGVQHLAFLTDDIVGSVKLLKEQGIEFLDVPLNYYEDIKDRFTHKISDSMLQCIRKYQILIDEDKNGYLMQSFSKPLQNSPTFFIEIIQRENAVGFGSGNIKALYTAVQKAQQISGLIK